jgi:hypothetical protein
MVKNVIVERVKEMIGRRYWSENLDENNNIPF